MTIDASLEIRKLPPSHLSQLSSILESAGQWKKLMAIIPNNLSKDNYHCSLNCGNTAKYNSDHIRLIEIASQKYNRAGAEIFLDEWGCSGRVRPSVGHLLNILVKAELFRAADYVAEKILHWQKPKRPSEGPAALVSTKFDEHIIEEILDNIDYSSSLLEDVVKEVNLHSNNNNLDHDRESASIPQIVVTPEADELMMMNENLSRSNVEQEVSSMMKFPVTSSQSRSTSSTFPVLIAPSVSDKSEISSGPNVPVMTIGSNLRNLSSLDEQSKSNIPNSIDSSYIPLISALIEPNIMGPNLEELISDNAQTHSCGSFSDSTGISIPDGDLNLIAPSISDKSEISSGPNVPFMTIGSNLRNLSSLDEQSDCNIHNSNDSSYIPPISALIEPNMTGPNLEELISDNAQTHSPGSFSNSTGISIHEGDSNLIAPSISDKSEISSGPNVPLMTIGSNLRNLSSLDKQSDCNIHNSNDSSYIPPISALIEPNMTGPNLEELISDNAQTHSPGSFSDSTGISIHDADSNLIAPSISDKSEVSSGPNVPLMTIGSNLRYLSSLDKQSDCNIHNSNDSSYIPPISALIEPNMTGPNLEELVGDNAQTHSPGCFSDSTGISIPDGDLVLIAPSISDKSEISSGPNVPLMTIESNLCNPSSLDEQSDCNIHNSNDSSYIPPISALIDPNVTTPNLEELISDNPQTLESFSHSVGITFPDIDLVAPVGGMDYLENKTEMDVCIPNLDCLMPETRRSSLNVSTNFDSSKVLHCMSPLPSLTLNTCLPHFAYQELEAATLNFNEEPFTTLSKPGRFLGSGAFGKVFLASGLFEKLVAVKKITLDNVEVVNVDDAVTKQFKNEVEVLSRFNHENLLALVGYSCDGCTYCLLYDYIAGGTLKNRLQNSQSKLMWEERVSIALDLSKAISYLHTAFSSPLIHRDIKTANILLDSSNKPKLGDFGITKLMSTQNTNTCTVIGTSIYMAPEAFRGDISVKLDTFSFGVVLLELLTSLPPFDENRGERDLVTYIQEQCEDSVQTVLDKTVGTWIRNDTNFGDEIFSVAIQCLEEKKRRPIMVDVNKMLADIVVKIQI